MKPLKPTLLFLFIFFLTFGSAFAGAWSSGGGSAVVCFNDPAVAQKVQDQNGLVTNEQLVAIDSIEMLDLFEWKRPRGMDGQPNTPLAEPQAGEKYPAFVKRITDRAYNTIGYNASGFGALGNYLYTYQSLFSDITQKNVMWTGTSLVHIGDEGTPMRFSGACTLVPIAVQQERGYDLRLFIDDRLFFHPKHSEQSRAAVFIHEFIYAMARDLGQTTSTEVRRALGLVMQNDPNASIDEVLSQVQGLGFRDPSPGMRSITEMAEMHVLSLISYIAYPRVAPVLNDDSFHAPSGRSEREITADVLKKMRETGVPNQEKGRFNANKAIAYLNMLPQDDLVKKLHIELTQLIQARSQAVRLALLKDWDYESWMEKALRGLGYVPESQVQAWTKLAHGPILDEIVALSTATGTEAQLELRRHQDQRYKYPMVSLDDLFSEKSTDGHTNDLALWINEVVHRQANEDYREIDLSSLKMPIL